MIIDVLINEIYSSVFYASFTNKKLYYGKELLSNKLSAIIEFLGLCYSSYKNGFKNEQSSFEYIKGSHYFNISYIKNKRMIKYHKIKPKKHQFDYTRSKIIEIHKNDFDKIKEQFLIKNLNNIYQIKFVDYKSYNLQIKYKDVFFKERKDIYLFSLKSFFKKFNT